MANKKSTKKVTIRYENVKLDKIRKAALADDLSINQFVVKASVAAADAVLSKATSRG